jgi:hypothetical protein
LFIIRALRCWSSLAGRRKNVLVDCDFVLRTVVRCGGPEFVVRPARNVATSAGPCDANPAITIHQFLVAAVHDDKQLHEEPEQVLYANR